MGVEEADIRKYLDNLDVYVEGVPACLVLNSDECGVWNIEDQENKYLSADPSVSMHLVTGKPDKQAFLQKDVEQAVNAVLMGSDISNFIAELFMESVLLCLFQYVEEWSERDFINVYNIIDAHDKATLLGTTQTAFKMVGIGHKVKA
ncbi:MAG: hypothetical protein EZS28_026111, partial [Streblomastix strix]